MELPLHILEAARNKAESIIIANNLFQYENLDIDEIAVFKNGLINTLALSEIKKDNEQGKRVVHHLEDVADAMLGNINFADMIYLNNLNITPIHATCFSEKQIEYHKNAIASDSEMLIGLGLDEKRRNAAISKELMPLHIDYTLGCLLAGINVDCVLDINLSGSNGISDFLVPFMEKASSINLPQGVKYGVCIHTAQGQRTLEGTEKLADIFNCKAEDFYTKYRDTPTLYQTQIGGLEVSLVRSEGKRNNFFTTAMNVLVN